MVLVCYLIGYDGENLDIKKSSLEINQEAFLKTRNYILLIIMHQDGLQYICHLTIHSTDR